MRIFANTSTGGFGGQLGCFSAELTNGATFSQPAIVGSILGVFAAVAFIASIATTVYGDDVPLMRTHYAHSLSVFVVFAVYQHIFFTGALSMNWPSVLPAFWSNYAWSGGMIFSQSMQDSIRKFVGVKTGNTSEVGAASSNTNQRLGGYDIHQIYARDLAPMDDNFMDIIQKIYKPRLPNALEKYLNQTGTAQGPLHFAKRELADRKSGFKWYGNPVPGGLPLPGNFSGFAGTLSVEKIPAANAFITGLVWFIIILAIVVASIAAFKGILELLIRLKRVRKARLNHFRQHWLRYCATAALRTCYIGFFTMTFLALFQFTYSSAAGPIAIAAIAFLVFLVGMFGLAGYACYQRLRSGSWVNEPDRIRFEKQRMLKVIPVLVPATAHEIKPDDGKKYVGSIPFWRLSHVKPELEPSVHDDVNYIQSFGWLNARFRRTRWWFFAAWLVYDFVRACFLGGASGHPLTQVFGLLVVEIIAFACLCYFKPFEGQRLNAVVVYCLGFSKVITVALSSAFDVKFNTARIPTTAIGIIIIVIQGILTVILLIAIILGAISSWFSVTRHRSDDKFRPKSWLKMRNRYLAYVERAALDVPPPPKPEPVKIMEPEVPKGPYFSVKSVKREPKVEDEDEDFQSELHGEKDVYYFVNEQSIDDADRTPSPNDQRDEISVADNRSRRRASRTLSMHSTMSHSSLPFGARPHRASWTMDSPDNYSLVDPAGLAGPPLPMPAVQRRQSDMSLLDSVASPSDRPRLGSRASVGALSGTHRYSSYSQGFAETPSASKRRSLGAGPSVDSFQMERSHPDYIASLNQAFSGNKTNDRPKSTGDLLEQADQAMSASPMRPASVQCSKRPAPGPIHTRNLSGSSSRGEHTPPQSPSSPLMPSPSRGMSTRNFRHSLPASPMLPEQEEDQGRLDLNFTTGTSS